MKKLLLLLIIPLFVFGFTQNVKERVLLIKKMYKETQELVKTGTKDCKDVSYSEVFDDDEYSRPYDRDITYCDFGQGYSRISCDFFLDHSAVSAEYYFIYNHLYFAYVIVHFGFAQDEYRLYFNEEGSVIRLLENIEDEGNTEVINQEERERLKEEHLYWLIKSQKALMKYD
jgi:hypothetical protein